MIFECNTIKNDVENIIYKEKGSKFIGYAFRVMNVGEVNKKLDVVKAIHPSATHHCYAYRLGFAGKKYRANDDGEPNGTAGLPIYNQLLSADLTFTLVVIVRYYGGTKLGVSGLIKAYKESTQHTLANTQILQLERKERLILHFPYSSQSDAMRTIEKYNADLITQTYMEDCELEIEIPKKKSKAFLDQLENFPSIEVLEVD
ncbi:MAG: IMPACT family protein [Weeksellaceae bacterium]